MVEYRTGQTTETESEPDTDIVDNALKRALNQLQGNPDAQKQIAGALAENYGIPPLVTGAFLPDATDGAQSHTENPSGQTEPMLPGSSSNDSNEQITTEDLVSFVNELTDYVGEDTTLRELVEYAESNPDVVQTAINLKL